MSANDPTQTSTQSHEHRELRAVPTCPCICRSRGCRSDFRLYRFLCHWRFGICRSGKLTRVFLEVRTLLPALVHLVSTLKSPSAGPAALPAPIGQVLVLTYAVFRGLRCGWIVGN